MNLDSLVCKTRDLRGKSNGNYCGFQMHLQEMHDDTNTL